MFDPNGKILPLPAEMETINKRTHDPVYVARKYLAVDEWISVSSGQIKDRTYQTVLMRREEEKT